MLAVLEKGKIIAPIFFSIYLSACGGGEAESNLSNDDLTTALVIEEPISGGPITGEPITGEPITGGPITGGPITGEPITGEPITGEPITGEPITGEPITGEPITDEPVVELSSVLIEWLDNSDNEDGFYIEKRKVGDADFRELNYLPRNTVNYTDKLPIGDSYCYQVSAFNAAGTSVSGEICIDIP